MNDTRHRLDPGEDEIARLLRSAGPRPPLPADDLAGIEDAARAAWRARWGTPRRHRSLPLLALAAAVVSATLAVGWWALRDRGPANPLATVAFVEGSGSLLGDGSSARPAVLGAGLAAPDRVATLGDDSLLSLRMAGGASVRLAAETQARLLSPEQIELYQGRLYVDVPAGAADIAILTPAGLMRPLGTQFEVAILDPADGTSVRLRVREGRVALGLEDGSQRVAAAGSELRVAVDGAVSERALAVYGDEWAWVVAAAPRPEIEGRAPLELLRTLARERGLRLDFANSEAAALARAGSLHGEVDQLSLEEITEVVLASAGLEGSVAEGVLRVSAPEN